MIPSTATPWFPVVSAGFTRQIRTEDDMASICKYGEICKYGSKDERCCIGISASLSAANQDQISGRKS